jgi:IS30 family transposase
MNTKNNNIKYKHFQLREREIIEMHLNDGKNISFVAKVLGRSYSSTWNEIHRNKSKINTSTDNKYGYRAKLSQQKYDKRMFTKGRKSFDLTFEGFRIFLKKFDKYFYSIDQIIMRFKNEFPYAKAPSRQTLYNWFDKKLISWPYRKQKYGRSYTNPSKAGKSIHDRPIGLTDYKSIGHYEIDLIIGRESKGCIVTLNHRATMKYYAFPIPTKEAHEVDKALQILIKDNNLENKINTITSDNGKEFYNKEGMEKEFNFKWYYADPGNSGQRGQNERINRDLRKFFPKGRILLNVTYESTKDAAEEISNLPRIKFKGLSSNEMEKIIQ